MSIPFRLPIQRPTATIAAWAVALSCVGAVASAPASAAGAAAITATNAWVRWLPNNLPAAGYVTLTNASDKNIDLTDVTSPDYGSAMLHQTVSNGSTTNMVMVDKATVPAHGSLKIAPGGYHIMLEEATHKVAPGDTVHLKLTFSDGETLVTSFAVKSPAAAK
jgi:copper(I)-binding protein